MIPRTPLLIALLLAIPLPPAPARYVTDNAGVLEGGAAARLNDKLAQFDRETSNQILVYVDRRVPAGTTLEEMSAEALHQWHVGQKKKDNGVIVFVFTDEHQMRIEVGYGLEARITDAQAKRITSTVLKPRLRGGDYAGALDAATSELMALARQEYDEPAPRHSAGGLRTIDVLVFFIGLGALIGLFVLLMQKARSADRAAAGARRLPFDVTPPASPSSSDGSWTFFDPGASSGGDSGGFTGGGGDSGGGGASDSW
jgi:uncharacterized protein